MMDMTRRKNQNMSQKKRKPLIHPVIN